MQITPVNFNQNQRSHKNNVNFGISITYRATRKLNNSAYWTKEFMTGNPSDAEAQQRGQTVLKSIQRIFAQTKNKKTNNLILDFSDRTRRGVSGWGTGLLRYGTFMVRPKGERSFGLLIRGKSEDHTIDIANGLEDPNLEKKVAKAVKIARANSKRIAKMKKAEFAAKKNTCRKAEKEYRQTIGSSIIGFFSSIFT